MARTSVIAAANPAGGHYDRSKTIAENLKISPALLSRFDLIFILLDKPNEATDKQLSEVWLFLFHRFGGLMVCFCKHVMALHGNKTSTHQQIAQRDGEGFYEQENSFCVLFTFPPKGIIVWQSQIRGASQQITSQAGQTLVARLKIGAESRFNPIPAKALRKYISYARRYVHPRMSESAANVLQKFYLRIRAQHATRDSTPITNRQLESLIRLAEARARLELRDLVSQVRLDFAANVFFKRLSARCGGGCRTDGGVHVQLLGRSVWQH